MLRHLLATALLSIVSLSGILLPTRTEAAVMVHFLVIEGDFDTNSTALESFKFRFEYDTAQTPALQTGQDLLNVLFGVRGSTPTVLNGKTFFSSTNGSYGATYEYFSSFDAYIVSQFTINGVTFPGSPLFTNGKYWNYQVAGGSGDFYEGNYPFLDENNNPAWTSAWDGISTRNLSNGSFDAFTFGTGANSDIAANLPTAANFSNLTALFTTANGITVYGSAVPEPGRSMLLAAGCVLLVFRRRRSKLLEKPSV
ncbi:PEP-CTERM sorting domain-containing protein [Verrucomicrobium sp. BvORR106]|uniref:PEP-CTERM sorting domain-containing protein n=1 Tax=Verrucomicrobium sp. BvORR106 TaxID=1403819 RepID=UPI0005715254|nr:PEP-CTERM sorting domain-containing protein [Verrucomicrobium sp. BvORR106]